MQLPFVCVERVVRLFICRSRQRKGVGRQLYEEFERISKRLNIPSMAMYTGLKNIPSYSLARVFGLDTAGRYREFQLDLASCTAPETVAAFEPVGEEEACQLLGTLAEKYEHFIIFNRTFMHMNKDIFSALAREGKVYIDRASGSLWPLATAFWRSVRCRLP